MWSLYPAVHSPFLPKWDVTPITPPCYLQAQLAWRGRGGMGRCCLICIQQGPVYRHPWQHRGPRTAGPGQRGLEAQWGRPGKQRRARSLTQTQRAAPRRMVLSTQGQEVGAQGWPGKQAEKVGGERDSRSQKHRMLENWLQIVTVRPRSWTAFVPS